MSALQRITLGDAERLTRFLDDLPDGDRTFFKEDMTLETVERWCADERNPRWYAVDSDGRMQALLSIVPGVAWTSHVGELRLVVGSDFRRQGLGRRLARHGLTEAVRLGLRKIVVEVVADKEGDIEMFTSIGFRAEALLANHICDREGQLRDLVLLSHEVDDVSSSMDLLGLDEAVGMGSSR
jgi:ribosomal protein S18 acetylase RimI-like enzyme